MEVFNDPQEAIDLIEQEEKTQEERKQKSKNFTNSNEDIRDFRFYLRPGEEASVVFIDDPYFPVREHKFDRQDRPVPHFETCIKEIEGECPADENGNYSYLAFVGTLINLAPKTKDGKTLDPQKKPIVIRQGAAKDVFWLIKKSGSLAGKKVTIKRSSSTQSPTTGSSHIIEKEANMEALKQFAPEGVDPDEWLQPFDYKEIFYPKSADELRQAMGIARPVGAEDSPTSEAASPAAQKAEKKTLDDLV